MDESRLCVDESRLCVDESRLCVDESRLCVDESRLCVDESRLCVDESRLCVDEAAMLRQPAGNPIVKTPRRVANTSHQTHKRQQRRRHRALQNITFRRGICKLRSKPILAGNINGYCGLRVFTLPSIAVTHTPTRVGDSNYRGLSVIGCRFAVSFSPMLKRAISITQTRTHARTHSRTHAYTQYIIMYTDKLIVPP